MAEVERLAGRSGTGRSLRPYVCPLAVEWIAKSPDERYRSVAGTLVFADVSGFTRLTERLASQGKAGAEEITELLDLVLGALLDASTERGGWLVKWGGDALLLMFDGDGHAARACAAATRMRAVIARVGRLDTSVGHIRLKISVAVNSGEVDYILAGQRHRELVVTGATATATAQLEGEASAGEILVGHGTAASIQPGCLGARLGSGTLLVRAPRTGPAPPRPDGEVARPRSLERAMDPAIAAALLAGAGAGEHRMVAVSFIEFRGVSELAERAGFPAVVDAVDRLVTVAQDAAARFGVTFHETDIGPDGGKILLVAGAPEARDEPEEALLLAVRETLDRFDGLRVRAGITSGRVFSGGLGPSYRRSYSIKGDVVNLAARIMGKAEPGQILALPEVVDASRTTFAVSPREPFSVKGKKRPVTAVAVGAPLGRGTEFGVMGGATPHLCGRAEELSVFEEAFRRAETGEGGTLIDLVGEPGLGKSELLSEVLARAGGRVLAGRGEPYHAATPYGVLGGLVRRALHVDAIDDTQVGVQLDAWSQAVAPDLACWLPLLAIALGASLPDTPETAALDERYRITRLHEVVVSALSDALDGPTVLVVDDAQHCDEASLAVLQKMAEALGARPWVLVVSHRPWTRGTEVMPTTADVYVREIVLPPLDPTSAAALVERDTHDAPLPRHVCAAILARGGGHPLFLRELVRSARSGSKELPDTVERVLAGGIDRLAPTDRLLLRACAVQGLRADPQLTARLVEVPFSPAAWRRLGGYLDRDGKLWRFRESLAREVAYEGLPYRQRAVLHGRLADLLSESESAVGSAVLSEHYFLAGRYESALAQSRAAADAATASYAFTEAAIAYERAIASAHRLPGHRAVLADLWYELGETRRHLGDYGEAETAYGTAHRLATDPSAQARTAERWAWSTSWRGAYALGLRRVRRSLEILRAHSADVTADPEALERARDDLLLREADIHLLQGRLQRTLEVAAKVMERSGTATLRQRAFALAMLHQASATLGDERSVRYGVDALAAYRELGDRLAEGRILLRMGIEEFYVGRWTQAVNRYEEAEDAYSSAGAGDTGEIALVSMNIAEVLVEQWRLDDAIARLDDVLRTFRASGAENMAAFATLLRGRALVRLERTDEGRQHLVEARASFAAQGSRAEVVDADAYIAELTSLEEHHGEALMLARSALRRANALAELPEKAPLLQRIIAESHHAAGETEKAEASYAEALRVARARRASYDVAFTLAALSAHRRRVGLDPDPGWDDEIEEISADLGLGVPGWRRGVMTGMR